MWAIAPSLSAWIEQDEAVGFAQGSDVSGVGPILQPAGKADVEHERRPAAVDLVANADSVVGCVRHQAPSARDGATPSGSRWRSLIIATRGTWATSWRPLSGCGCVRTRTASGVRPSFHIPDRWVQPAGGGADRGPACMLEGKRRIAAALLWVDRTRYGASRVTSSGQCVARVPGGRPPADRQRRRLRG